MPNGVPKPWDYVDDDAGWNKYRFPRKSDAGWEVLSRIPEVASGWWEHGYDSPAASGGMPVDFRQSLNRLRKEGVSPSEIAGYMQQQIPDNLLQNARPGDLLDVGNDEARLAGDLWSRFPSRDQLGSVPGETLNEFDRMSRLAANPATDPEMLNLRPALSTAAKSISAAADSASRYADLAVREGALSAAPVVTDAYTQVRKLPQRAREATEYIRSRLPKEGDYMPQRPPYVMPDVQEDAAIGQLWEQVPDRSAMSRAAVTLGADASKFASDFGAEAFNPDYVDDFDIGGLQSLAPEFERGVNQGLDKGRELNQAAFLGAQQMIGRSGHAVHRGLYAAGQQGMSVADAAAQQGMRVADAAGQKVGRGIDKIARFTTTQPRGPGLKRKATDPVRVTPQRRRQTGPRPRWSKYKGVQDPVSPSSIPSSIPNPEPILPTPSSVPTLSTIPNVPPPPPPPSRHIPHKPLLGTSPAPSEFPARIRRPVPKPTRALGTSPAPSEFPARIPSPTGQGATAAEVIGASGGTFATAMPTPMPTPTGQSITDWYDFTSYPKMLLVDALLSVFDEKELSNPVLVAFIDAALQTAGAGGYMNIATIIAGIYALRKLPKVTMDDVWATLGYDMKKPKPYNATYVLRRRRKYAARGRRRGTGGRIR